MSFIPAEIIKKKRNGGTNTQEEIKFLIESYSSGDLPDYQMSAWAMAVYFNDLNAEETATLTKAMKDSGHSYDFSDLKNGRVDKHSTGGVGDKASLILGPIVAACHVHVPMISGQGLGHTGGTVDKLESIPGFRMDISNEEFERLVREHYMGLIKQTKNVCPADKKFYSLRDVTATVESLPLICGSIMSKKLSEGINGLVLDVKFGSGAFMKTVDQARELASLLKRTGEASDVKVTALLTNMDQPLGKFIGNTLEVHECIEILEGKTNIKDGFDFYNDTRELSLQLSAHMIHLGGQAGSVDEGYQKAKDCLESGRALEKFLEICKLQGPSDPYKIEKAKYTKSYIAKSSGYLQTFQTEKIGLASLELGAGRKKITDIIDVSAGLEIHHKVGHKVSEGQSLITMYANDESLFAKCEALLEGAITISKEPVKAQTLIADILH